MDENTIDPVAPLDSPTEKEDEGSGSTEYFEPLEKGHYPNTQEVLPLKQDILKEIEMEKPKTIGPQVETLRTYKSDVAEAVKKQNTSTIKIAVAEQKRKIDRGEIKPVMPRPHTEADTFTRSRKNFTMIFASAFLILAGVGVGWYVYNRSKQPAQSTPIILPGNPIIKTDFQKEIQVGSDQHDLKDLITTEKNQNHPAGSVESIYFTEKTAAGRDNVDVRRFVSLLSLQFPGAITRALSPEFMLGVHNIKDGKLFLILKPSYFEGAFGGMLAWEKSMVDDLAPLFGSKKSASAYQDLIIKNNNTRIQYDETGETTLVYSFINKNYIVIAEDEETIAEIAHRLAEVGKTVY